MIFKMRQWGTFQWFLLGMAIVKIGLMVLFTSDYQQNFFVPFVQNYLENMGTNPYDSFWNQKEFIAFPYPPLMLFIFSIGRSLSSLLGGGTFPELVFKLPLLAFDFLGLYFLLKLFPSRRRIVGLLYFASPIILYSTYMHGQLDIIPTALLVGSLYFLFQKQKNNLVTSSLLLAAALLTKFHILAILPAIFILLWKKHNIQNIFVYFSVLFVVAFGVLIPFSSEIFWESVLWNKEQSLLTQVYFNFVSLEMYLPVMALGLIYLHEYMLVDTNRSLFLSFCGLLFGVFLVLIPPMPGWYVWIVPFITLYFVEVNFYRERSIVVFVLFNALYLLYFMTAHNTQVVDLYFCGVDLSFLKVNSSIYVNVLFTLLSTTLVYIVYCMYRLGVANNNFYKRKGKPFTIAIAGDSGAGKSTLLEMVFRCFGRTNTLQIEGDGDHRWERNAPMWSRYTHLNPKANYLYRQAKDIDRLKHGESIRRVDYDHNTGRFTEALVIKPKRFIVLSGLHAFYLPQMREIMDLKLFMDTDEALRTFWKIKRDTEKRGYSLEKILAQIEMRKGDSDVYIAPQKQFADLSITYFDKTLVDCCDLSHQVVMSLKLTLSLAVDLERLLNYLELYHIEFSHEFSEGLCKQTVVVDGLSMQETNVDFSRLVYQLIPHYDEITDEKFSWSDAKDAIIQLVMLMIVSQKMQQN